MKPKDQPGTEKQDRYPGARAFEQTEQGLFYGREEEAHSLFRLARVAPLVVLFARSGIGKSSLLNAGLLPLLTGSGYYPLFIRLQEAKASPLSHIMQALAPYQGASPPYQTQSTLWAAVKTASFPEGRLPVLLFDQFEEFFRHPKDSREEFTRQLAALLNDQPPDEVEAWLQSIPVGSRTDEHLQWYHSPPVRIILSIRSNQLSALNEMSREMPAILHNRFELKPFHRGQARKAIILPASLWGESFRTPPFSFQEETIADMLRNLASPDTLEVEPFQLQILCREVEKKVRQRVAAGERDIAVTPGYLGGKEGIADILNNYYENQIAALGTATDQLAARRLLEEELIADGKRIGLAEESVKISEELLKKLLDSRLVRLSATHLGRMYEISHDTLVEPILRSYEERRVKEERIRRERRLAEERRKRRRALGFAFGGVMIAVLALALAWLAWTQRNAARAATQAATAGNLATRAIWQLETYHHSTRAFRLAQHALQLSNNTNMEALRTFYSSIYPADSVVYPLYVSLAGHRGKTVSAAFSPVGNQVLTASADSTAILWNLNGSPAMYFRGHTAPLLSAGFSHDGTYLLTVAEDSAARIWNPSGARLAVLREPRKSIRMARFFSAQDHILTVFSDNTARIWSKEGEPLADFSSRKGAFSAAAVSPASPYILTASLDDTARVWNAWGQPAGIMANPDTLIYWVELAPGGGLAVAIDLEGGAGVWDMHDPMRLITRLKPSPDHLLQSIAISPTEELIATTSPDTEHTTQLWRLNGSRAATLEGHGGRIYDFDFSPGGQWVAGASADGRGWVWTTAGQLAATLSGHEAGLQTVAFSPDGQHLLTTSEDGTARIWLLYNPFRSTISNPDETISEISLAKAAPELLAVSSNGEASLWSLAGERLTRFSNPEHYISQGMLSRNGGRLLTFAWGEGFRLWNREGEQLASYTEKEREMIAATLSPDGQRVFFLWGDGGAGLWTGGSGPAIPLEAPGISDGVFSPQSNYLLTPAADSTIYMWDLDGTLLGRLEGHKSPVIQAVCSPQESWILTVAEDGTVKLWRGKYSDGLGTFVANLHPIDGWMHQAWFTPDERYAVALSASGYLYAWSTGPELKQDSFQFRKILDKYIEYAAFEPQNGYLLSGNLDQVQVHLARPGARFGELVLQMRLKDGQQGQFSADDRYLVVLEDGQVQAYLLNAKLIGEKADTLGIARLTAAEKRKLGIKK